MLAQLPAPKSIQNNKTVTTANGMAATCMNGILLPRLHVLLSLKEAINGSVTASKIRLNAVINPMMVKNPPMTNPPVINWVAPAALSAAVGMKNVTNQAEMIPPSNDQPNWPREKIIICFLVNLFFMMFIVRLV